MRSEKYMKLLGIIACIAASLSLAAYSIAYYRIKVLGETSDDLYFIATGITVAMFSGLNFYVFKNIVVRVFLLFCCGFWTAMETLFIYSTFVENEGYAYVKLSLFFGLGIGIIYALYNLISYVITHHFRNRPVESV